MHFHFDFSVRPILWTLTFAAELVLLVVLLGRDRLRRYPWFTAVVCLHALRLMAEVLLTGRIAVLNLQEMLLVLNDLTMVATIVLTVEVARRAFAGASRLTWINGSIAVVLLSGLVVLLWGPWPIARDMALNTLLGKLRLMSLIGQRGDIFADLLLLQLGVLVALFGKKFRAPWRSHAQMIVLGLAAVALDELGTQQAWRLLTGSIHPHTQQEYQHLVNLGTQFMNANSAVYLAALIWWIVWLWRDEPGTDADGNRG